MCDADKDTKRKGDEGVGITKPKPMEHEFKTKAEETDFAEWVNGHKPTSKIITNKLKRDLRNYRIMKKRQNEGNN